MILNYDMTEYSYAASEELEVCQTEIPAGTFTNSTPYVECRFAGRAASSSNPKRLKLTWENVLLFNGDVFWAGNWEMLVRIYSMATLQEARIVVNTPDSTLNYLWTNPNPGEDYRSRITTLDLRCQLAYAGDLTRNLMLVEGGA